MNRSLWHGAGILSLVGIIALAAGLLYSIGSADLVTQDQQPIPFNHAFQSGQLSLSVSD
jgi:hypothetical protein